MYRELQKPVRRRPAAGQSRRFTSSRSRSITGRKGQFWEAVQQQGEGSAWILVPGLQQKHSQAIHALDEARTNARAENGAVEGR